MNIVKLHKLTLIWLLIGIPVLSYLLFKKTFNLALYGDDWLQLYNIWVSFDVRKELSFFDIRSYIGAYWPQYFFLGLIRYISGYQAQAYFAFSLILRILAAISIFILIKKVSGNYLAGFLASLIFIFSAAGLQTTDWVFNMNTYAGIFFLNLALFFYFKLRGINSYLSWHYPLFVLFFTLALAVVPVRMHGALPFLIITEIFLYTFFDKKNVLKFNPFLIIRLILPTVIMYFLFQVGSFGSEGEILPQLQSSFLYLQDKAQKGQYDVLFYFLGIIGNIVIPDTFNMGNTFNSSAVRILFFTTFGLLVAAALRAGKKIFITIIIVNIVWAIISKMLLVWNPLLSVNSLFSISAGFQLLFLSFIAISQTKKTYPALAIPMMAGLFWIISFTLLYWLKTPYLIIESTGRYMSMGAAGLSFLCAGLLSAMIKNFSMPHINKAFIILPIVILSAWISINYIEMDKYLTNLETNRNLLFANKTWDILKKSVPDLDKNGPSVFYFTYDNSIAANMILVFGFSPHAGLSYGISNWEKTPVPTEDYQQLLNMVKNGEPMNKIHARDYKPVPIERVFAFDLRNGQLINITNSIRPRIIKDIENNAQ